MLLILSARSVSDDIALQFGRLPPSFLPLGSRRLFSFQVESALGGPCFMTVPDDFPIPASDACALEQDGITLLPQSQKLSLTQAIGSALAHIKPQGPVRILYGDTLVSLDENALQQDDLVAVQSTTANYAWAYVRSDKTGQMIFSDEPPDRIDSRRVVCGYYSFSDPELLAEACNENSIVQALNAYNDQKPLDVVDAERWLDFGHLPLYFRSKKDILVKRVFNDLEYTDHMLVKRSADTSKMRAEAHWYENLPQALQLHVPRYCGRVDRGHRAGYALEYMYAPLLSDLAVFGDLPLASWLEIVQGCFDLLEKFHAIHPPEESPEASEAFAAQFFEDVIVRKTWSRLGTYSTQSGLSLDAEFVVNGVPFPSLRRVTEMLIQQVPQTTPEHMRFWHGDLFFGNMFYDFTAQRVLCIDPRGQLASGQMCLYGDMRYDLAKLAHSILGQYDKILLGRSKLRQTDDLNWQLEIDTRDHQDLIETIYLDFVNKSCGVTVNELLALTALLFLSMLPIHHDDPEKQKQFLANGLRLAGHLFSKDQN